MVVGSMVVEDSAARMGCRLLIVVVFLFVILPVSTSHEHSDEYCDTEVFRAECSEGEVIILGKAHYGRMRIGRCVELDMGHIGCSADVLRMADRRCSGKRMCELRVPDAEFETTQPCLKELKTYMEASYTCVKVETVTTDYCKMADELNVTSPSGYIASIVTSDTYLCDGVSHPWVIYGLPGQRVNLTLYDFASLPSQVTYELLSRDRDRSDVVEAEQVVQACRKYGTIEDSGSYETTTICGLRRQRVSSLFVSQGNVVRLWITGGAAPNDFKRFLIQYTVIGCGDPDLPEMAWFKRETDTRGIMGCEYTEVTWQVDCENGQWNNGPTEIGGTSSDVCSKPTTLDWQQSDGGLTGSTDVPAPFKYQHKTFGGRAEYQPEQRTSNDNQIFEFAGLLIVTITGSILIIILILIIARITRRRKGRDDVGNCAETVLLRPTSDEPELKVHHHHHHNPNHPNHHARHPQEQQQNQDKTATTPTTLPSPVVCAVDSRTLAFSMPATAVTTTVASSDSLKRLGHVQSHLAKGVCNGGGDALANGREVIDDGEKNGLNGTTTVQKTGKKGVSSTQQSKWSKDVCQKTNHGATVSPNSETDI